jgi:hypothetical protein
VLLSVGLVLLVAGYGVYDWTRPCTGGPVTQIVKSLAHGGSYTVRCAG